MKTRNTLFIVICVSLMTTGFVIKTDPDYTRKIDDKVRAEQIKELKFGMFICWSSVPSQEMSGHLPLIKMPSILKPKVVIQINGAKWQKMPG
ncbi:MAG TPA: hypothetical protein VF298_04270 [Bacteroidales bacterium]